LKTCLGRRISVLSGSNNVFVDKKRKIANVDGENVTFSKM